MDSHASGPPRTPSPPAETRQPTNTARGITNKHLKTAQETPRGHHRTESRSHASGTMAEHRVDAVKDIRDIPKVSLEYYEKHILPSSIYRDHLAEITKALEDEKVLKKFDGEEGLRWTDFPNDPKDSKPQEDETFKYMATIAAAIVKAAQKVISGGPEPTTVMECRPNEPTLSEGRNGGFKSDGHYRLLQSRRPNYIENATSTTAIELPDLIKKSGHKLLCDRPALEEYKKGDTIKDRNDDFEKLVGNASEAMYADPTRRFMFGTTIENRTARFWFFSRAIVLVSESFDFLKDYTHLIRYMLSLSFAKPEELGYDMSVTRVAYPLAENPSEHAIQYDYCIDGKTYRTVKCLSSFRASGLLSRATRVWTVCQIKEEGHPLCALKDVWIPSNAQTELEIQQEIFHSIEQNHPEIGKGYREKYFMKIVACEVVKMPQGCNDDMPAFVRGPLEIIGDLALYTPETAKEYRIMPGSTISTPTGASAANPDADNKPQPPRLYNGRKHVRVVFAEIGKPLSDIQQLPVLFKALSDALTGLHYLYMGHYVHRDISAGNIILCDGMGKISDLEYAKRFLSNGPVNDPKTGTPIYMAVEVQDAAYLFFDRFTQKSRASIPFIHNYLHDVESLFWIGFHALFSTVPAKYSKDDLAQRLDQRTLFNAFFPHRLEGSVHRSHFFEHGVLKDGVMGALPTEYRSSAELILSIHQDLSDYYYKVENLTGFPQHEQFKQVYGTAPPSGLLASFKAAAKEAYSGDTQSLFPDKTIITTRPAQVVVYRETTDNDDRDDDQTFVPDELEGTESLEDDEEPPSKVRRKNGKTKEKATGSSHRTSFKQDSVKGTHSGGKRKRL
ncbi:hypothetical protein IW261DRAFT_1416033 [Armillaria novae-zelandiae]|uniref:Fungal-type protein kinase domain-containing protein n=1 Tax=Armillaria novae-zelandiae TaxID=153914 RepID=A0AA39PL43_9AGAR|nr:hypothetical protein IW261DRAFT_1416033 [Armillaria novae-zelandiae]